jgi:hypothetical protein
MRQVVREIVAPDGKARVEIFRRDDGTFGFAAWRWSDEPHERNWIPYGRFSECFVSDEQTAETEARGRVDWLRAMQDDD